MSTTKDPVKVAAGKIGARTRWGEQPRVVRLDELTADQRRLVLTLVEAAKPPSVARLLGQARTALTRAERMAGPAASSPTEPV